MALLVRKIEKAKWLQNDILAGEDVSADAITNCMKTRMNALSVWEIGGEEELHNAVLAMASQFQHLDTIDVVVLLPAAVAEAGLSVRGTNGATPVKDLAGSHRDLVSLTYRSLGKLAGLIVDGIRQKNVHRYTKQQLKRLLEEAIQAGRLSRDQLQESLRSRFA